MELTSSQRWMVPSPNSGLPPSAFHIIPYHARWRTNVNLKTFFVFPDVDGEMEDAEDEMEMDEDIQDTAGLEEVPSDEDENDSQ
jgi:hypothetical protein